MEKEKLTIDDIRKMTKSVLTAYEVSEILGISINTFYRNFEKWNFPIERAGRKYIIPRELFLEFLSSGKSPKIEMFSDVTTVCYGKTRKWDSRAEARRYFLDAMLNADGSERERYANVYFQIVEGCEVCKDTDDD